MVNDLRIKASANNSVSYTINAEVIYQGTLTTSIVTIYNSSVTLNTIENIQFSNDTASAVTLTFYVNGVLPVNQVLTFSIPANGSALYKEDGSVDIMDSTGTIVNVIGLTDTELRASPVPVSGTITVTDVATSTKQDEQTALLNTLNSLLETNNALVQMMSQLIGAMNSGSPALRVTPIASVSTAVTGSVTATVASTVVSSLTNFGTGIPAKKVADDINNMTVQLSNINNITF